MGRLRRSFIAAVAGGVLAILPARAIASADPNAAIKAAIIYNFTRFSTWGPNRFSGPASPVVICIDAGNPLAPELQKLEGKPVGSRRLAVRRSSAVDAACHAAVLSPGKSSAADIAAATRMGVLTIGDSPGFAKSGAIGLVTVGRQVRFEVNNRTASDSGVELSSKLLRLAVSIR